MLVTTTVALVIMLLIGALGCASTSDESTPPRELKLPADAKLVVAGPGDADLSYKASEDGRVWAYDETAGRVLTRHRLRAGQRFTFSPSNDQASVDGHPVTDIQKVQLDPRHQYRLYFERE
jgi:hypothetical protein